MYKILLVHLGYHKISTSSLYGIGCGDLMIPEIRCCFYVNGPFYEFIFPVFSWLYTNFVGGKVEVTTYISYDKNNNNIECIDIIVLVWYNS